MTIPTPPTRLQLTEDHYVADLSSLFRRYRLACGAPACLQDLGPELEANAALRGDLFNLLSAISHMGESDLSAEELLTLVARAAGGPRFASGELEIPSTTRKSFLDLYEQWSARVWESMASVSEDATAAPAPDDTVWHMPVGRFSAAAARAGETRPAPADLDGSDAEGQSITPETRIGELTISQLRTYLDDIETRVGRLKPYFAPIARTGEGVVGLGAPTEGGGDQVDPAAEVRTEDVVHPRSQDTAAVIDIPGNDERPVRPGREDKPSAPKSPIAPEANVVLAPTPQDLDGTNKASSHGSGTGRTGNGQSESPVVLLPLRVDREGSAQPMMFRSVDDDSKAGPRVLPWLAAAILLLGAAGGYKYRIGHQAHPATAPASVPANSETPASNEEVRPAAAPAPTHPPLAEVPKRKTVLPDRVPSEGRRHRQIASQPRLLPHEVQMAAEAARAGAAAQNSPSGTTNEPR